MRRRFNDFIAQCLKNTYLLKERICSVSGVDVWITRILVFSNAFVPFGKPMKGVRVTNRKFLLEQMRKGTPAKGVSAVWEARERIASSTTR